MSCREEDFFVKHPKHVLLLKLSGVAQVIEIIRRKQLVRVMQLS